jgi:RHS repeat-associated protein
VLVNTRTKDLCTVPNAFRCGAATTRMVWAGYQLLWEIRRASESPNERMAPAEAYGTVSYSHAGGIDRPLVITKDGVSILPHQNWRGEFSSGTRPDGARSDCAPGVTTSCIAVRWPGYRTTAWHHDAKEPDIRTWWGGLVDGMRDASGQQYKRNRYYDPATGQFTQPDPIGIAGGLNSYGFAAGDPVTYDDPYGLCPKEGSSFECPIVLSQVTVNGGLRPMEGVDGTDFLIGGGFGGRAASPLLGRLARGLRGLLFRRAAAETGGSFATKGAARQFVSNLALPEAQETAAS